MAVVTVFSATHCRAEEIAAEAARRLGYRLVHGEILELAGREAGCSVRQLEKAMAGRFLFSLHPERERARRIAHLRTATAEILSRDATLHHGFAGHLVPAAVTHVLRVGVLASLEYRLARVREKTGLSERKARKLLEEEDLGRWRWTRYLHELGPWEQEHYDVRIPVHDVGVDEAVGLIEVAAKRDAVRVTAESRAALADFALASEVEVALADRGIQARVDSAGGNVTVVTDLPAWRWERRREQLFAIVATVPGVRTTEIRRAPPPSTSFYREEEFQLPTRVLLVDDEREFVLALSERLEMRRLEPSVACDGEEALAIIEEKRPDVIVLDLQMPGMDGMEVLERVKREHPEVEVIMLTGHGTDQDEARAKELGAYAYLRKPVEIDELERTVRAAKESVGREREEE